MARLAKKEVKKDYVVIKGFVGLPDEDGTVEDVLPYKMAKGKPVRKDGELEWKMVKLSCYPSKVAHIVASGKLCLLEEMEEFYPELFDQMATTKTKDDPKK